MSIDREIRVRGRYGGWVRLVRYDDGAGKVELFNDRSGRDEPLDPSRFAELAAWLSPAPVPVEETRDGDGEFVVEPVPYVLRPGPVMTNSAVRIRHEPTGIAVICDEHKSQLANKDEALRRLRLILAAASPPPVGDGRLPEVVREALEFYADEANYEDGAPGTWERIGMGTAISYGGSPDDTEFEWDGGDRARAALRTIVRAPPAPSPVQGGGLWTTEQIADELSETLLEVEREPRTNLWLAFWDRLTQGADELPPWPFDDHAMPHLAPSQLPVQEGREPTPRMVAAVRAVVGRQFALRCQRCGVEYVEAPADGGGCQEAVGTIEAITNGTALRCGGAVEVSMPAGAHTEIVRAVLRELPAGESAEPGEGARS